MQKQIKGQSLKIKNTTKKIKGQVFDSLKTNKLARNT